MVYTVKQLATLANVSVRTLHYYDAIGLLTPSFIKENGYRFYEEKELMKLQQILFFKELEFPLEEIILMINAANFNKLEALIDHRKLLELKKLRIESLLLTIDKTIYSMKGGEKMNTDDLFSSFADDQTNQYKKEVEEKWGHTKAYKQSAERTKQWTKEDFQKVREEGESINKAIVKNMDKGEESQEIQQLISRHYQQINKFYDCSYEMYQMLGKMYVEDIRFANNYNKLHPQLAEFMQKAIAYFCDQQR